jgi:hypothetical protein
MMLRLCCELCAEAGGREVESGPEGSRGVNGIYLSEKKGLGFGCNRVVYSDSGATDVGMTRSAIYLVYICTMTLYSILCTRD